MLDILSQAEDHDRTAKVVRTDPLEEMLGRGGWAPRFVARPTGATLPDMVGVKDRQDTGGARHVILASCGMGPFGHTGYWFRLWAGKLLRNSIEWSKNGAQ